MRTGGPWRTSGPGGVAWHPWHPWLGRRVFLALVIGVVQVGGTYLAARHQTTRRPFDFGAVLLLAAGPAALAVRRRAPTTVLLWTFAATLLYWELRYPRGPIFLALIVAFAAAVVAGRRWVAYALVPVGYVCFVWLGYWLGREPWPGPGAAFGVPAWLLVLLAASQAARYRRERVGEARARAADEARRRAGEERLRIARELHDVLAHNISLINVQAGVALHLLDEQPEQARPALAAIKQASKDALVELRSVLGVLRQVDEAAPRAPAPGLARLDDLVAWAAAAGIEVDTRTVGEPRPLPARVDLAAFRIVQEALTNVARHAGATAAAVEVAYGAHELTVQIDDTGQGAPPLAAESPGAGSGITGMRERAATLGGELTAGPRPGGGFRVRASLPLNGAR